MQPFSPFQNFQFTQTAPSGLFSTLSLSIAICRWDIDGLDFSFAFTHLNLTPLNLKHSARPDTLIKSAKSFVSATLTTLTATKHQL